ncbi:MAG: phage minor head protein [Negativibacillus sp.]
MDAYGDERTEELLEELEKRIHQTYKQAHSEMQDKIDAYFSRLKERDGEQKALLDAGKITKQEYEQWRLAQIARGKRYEALRDEYAQRMTAANQQAAAYINDQTPGIYSLNQNYAAYTIERISGNVGFTLIDEQTVRRLIQENPDLFYRPAIDTPLDTVWNRKKLTAELCSGILQGESIGQIADRFQNVSDMNRTSALRNARTAVTNAQNAGRQASYDRAKAMGLPQRKYWMATKDLKTRESHRKMDGVAVELDGWFTTPLGSVMQYPGDRNGKPADYYNCRCTVSTREKEGIEAEARMMRVRDPVTGENVLVQEMTYQEWEAWKENLEKAQARVIMKVKDKLDLPKEAVVNFPPKYINTEKMEFDGRHINKERAHAVTEEQAREWIMDAKVSVTVWKGQYERYYACGGAVYVDLRQKLIRTAYPKGEFTEKLVELMEVLQSDED